MRLPLMAAPAGMAAENAFQLQVLNEKIADDLGTDRSLVLLASFLVLAGGVGIATFAAALARRFSLRLLAFASAFLAAAPLLLMSRANSVWWLMLVGPVLGFMSGSLTFVHIRVLKSRELFAAQDGSVTKWLPDALFWGAAVVGIAAGKWLDGHVVDVAAEWRAGFVAQAGASAIVGLLLLGLVGKGKAPKEEQTDTRERAAMEPARHGRLGPIGRTIDGATLRPPTTMKLVGRWVIALQVALMLFDNTLPSMLAERGFALDRVGILATSTFVPGAVLGALAAAVVAARARGILTLTFAIVVVWPITWVALDERVPRDAFLPLIWFGELVLEAVTSTGTSINALLMQVLLVAAYLRGAATARAGVAVIGAYSARCRNIGQLSGTLLVAALFFAVERYDVELSQALGAVGTVAGIYALWRTVRLRRQFAKVRRVHVKGAVYGTGTGLAMASFTGLTAFFLPVFIHEVGVVRAYALIACGWAGMLAAVGWSMRRRARMHHWSVVVGAALAGALSAALIAVTYRPDALAAMPIALSRAEAVAVALFGLGCAAGVFQGAEIAARREEAAAGKAVGMNTTILSAETITNVVVIGGIGVLSAVTGSWQGPHSGSWEWAYWGIAGLLLVQAVVVFVFRGRLPSFERRPAGQRDKPLWDFITSPQTRLTILSMVGARAPYAAAYAVMSDLITARGGFDGSRTGWVILALSCVRVFAGPVPLVASRFIGRGSEHAARVAYGVAIAAGGGLAVVATTRELALALGFGAGVLVIEISLAVGYAALRSRRDQEPNQGMTATVSRASSAIAGIVVSFAAAGVRGLFDALSQAWPGRILGLGVEDLGRSFVLLLGVSGMAMLAYTFGPRLPLVPKGKRATFGHGPIALAVVPPESDGDSPGLIIHSRCEEAIDGRMPDDRRPRWLSVNRLAPGEKVRIAHRDKGRLLAEIEALRQPVKVAATAVLQKHLPQAGAYLLRGPDGTAYHQLIWKGRDRVTCVSGRHAPSATLWFELERAGYRRTPPPVHWLELVGDMLCEPSRVPAGKEPQEWAAIPCVRAEPETLETAVKRRADNSPFRGLRPVRIAREHAHSQGRCHMRRDQHGRRRCAAG